MDTSKAPSNGLSFTLKCADGSVCTGIASRFSQKHTVPVDEQQKPLLVGVHGGSCNASYFDLSCGQSAMEIATCTGLPFVAFDRPSYGGTTPIKKEGNVDFWTETAHRMHKQILPLLWKDYGLPNGCTSLVLSAHSFGCPPTIITAVLHADDKNAAYPLSGLILSGWGGEVDNVPISNSEPSDDSVEYTMETKELMMLGDNEAKYCHASTLAAVREQHHRQNSRLPKAEFASIRPWYADAADLCSKVRVPILHTMGDKDWLLKVSEELMQRFVRMFVKSPRVDISITRGAPHALEWSKGGAGYYLRCFGWASEVSSI